MAIEVRWSPSARADLRSARAWLQARSPEAAARFAEGIRSTVRLLKDFPLLGAVAQDIEPVGRYRHVVKGHHRIIYRVDGSVLLHRPRLGLPAKPR